MLSTQFKTTVNTVASSLSMADMSSKELFNVAYNEYLGASKEQHKSVTKEINSYLEDAIKSDAIRSGIKRIVTVARKYLEMKAITHLDIMTYESIRQTVSLLSFIQKHRPDELKTVRNKIGRVKKDSKVGYNNALQAKVKEIKAHYSISEVDGELKILSANVLYNTLEKSIDTYSKEDIQKLMELLESKLQKEDVA